MGYGDLGKKLKFLTFLLGKVQKGGQSPLSKFYNNLGGTAALFGFY